MTSKTIHELIPLSLWVNGERGKARFWVGVQERNNNQTETSTATDWTCIGEVGRICRDPGEGRTPLLIDGQLEGYIFKSTQVGLVPLQTWYCRAKNESVLVCDDVTRRALRQQEPHGVSYTSRRKVLGYVTPPGVSKFTYRITQTQQTTANKSTAFDTPYDVSVSVLNPKLFLSKSEPSNYFESRPSGEDKLEVDPARMPPAPPFLEKNVIRDAKALWKQLDVTEAVSFLFEVFTAIMAEEVKRAGGGGAEEALYTLSPPISDLFEKAVKGNRMKAVLCRIVMSLAEIIEIGGELQSGEKIRKIAVRHVQYGLRLNHFRMLGGLFLVFFERQNDKIQECSETPTEIWLQFWSFVVAHLAVGIQREDLRCSKIPPKVRQREIALSQRMLLDADPLPEFQETDASLRRNSASVGDVQDQQEVMVVPHLENILRKRGGSDFIFNGRRKVTLGKTASLRMLVSYTISFWLSPDYLRVASKPLRTLGVLSVYQAPSSSSSLALHSQLSFTPLMQIAVVDGHLVLSVNGEDVTGTTSEALAVPEGCWTYAAVTFNNGSGVASLYLKTVPTHADESVEKDLTLVAEKEVGPNVFRGAEVMCLGSVMALYGVEGLTKERDATLEGKLLDLNIIPRVVSARWMRLAADLTPHMAPVPAANVALATMPHPPKKAKKGRTGGRAKHHFTAVHSNAVRSMVPYYMDSELNRIMHANSHSDSDLMNVFDPPKKRRKPKPGRPVLTATPLLSSQGVQGFLMNGTAGINPSLHGKGAQKTMHQNGRKNKQIAFRRRLELSGAFRSIRVVPEMLDTGKQDAQQTPLIEYLPSEGHADTGGPLIEPKPPIEATELPFHFPDVVVDVTACCLCGAAEHLPCNTRYYEGLVRLQEASLCGKLVSRDGVDAAQEKYFGAQLQTFDECVMRCSRVPGVPLERMYSHRSASHDFAEVSQADIQENSDAFQQKLPPLTPPRFAVVARRTGEADKSPLVTTIWVVVTHESACDTFLTRDPGVDNIALCGSDRTTHTADTKALKCVNNLAALISFDLFQFLVNHPEIGGVWGAEGVEVYFTGHGLGGCVAQVLHTFFATHEVKGESHVATRCVVFGAPNVLVNDSRETHTSLYVNNTDIVPKMLSASILRDAPLISHSGLSGLSVFKYSSSEAYKDLQPQPTTAVTSMHLMSTADGVVVAEMDEDSFDTFVVSKQAGLDHNVKAYMSSILTAYGLGDRRVTLPGLASHRAQIHSHVQVLRVHASRVLLFTSAHELRTEVVGIFEEIFPNAVDRMKHVQVMFCSVFGYPANPAFLEAVLFAHSSADPLGWVDRASRLWSEVVLRFFEKSGFELTIERGALRHQRVRPASFGVEDTAAKMAEEICVPALLEKGSAGEGTHSLVLQLSADCERVVGEMFAYFTTGEEEPTDGARPGLLKAKLVPAVVRLLTGMNVPSKSCVKPTIFTASANNGHAVHINGNLSLKGFQTLVLNLFVTYGELTLWYRWKALGMDVAQLKFTAQFKGSLSTVFGKAGAPGLTLTKPIAHGAHRAQVRDQKQLTIAHRKLAQKVVQAHSGCGLDACCLLDRIGERAGEGKRATVPGKAHRSQDSRHQLKVLKRDIKKEREVRSRKMMKVPYVPLPPKHYLKLAGMGKRGMGGITHSDAASPHDGCSDFLFTAFRPYVSLYHTLITILPASTTMSARYQSASLFPLNFFLKLYPFFLAFSKPWVFLKYILVI